MVLETLSATIDETGIYTPQFVEILESLMDSFRAIYGQDIDIAPDTQDGQWLAILAKAIYDSNNMAVAAYNSFNPTYAVGAGLSSLVKLNGLKRKISTYSSVVVRLEGTVGTVIANGAVSDDNGNRWLLPPYVEIPYEGFADVTATAGVSGDIRAPANTVVHIDTPTPGWYSVTNQQPATLGAPVESDALLRQRQAISTSRPATNPATSILASVLSLPGVERGRLYENNTDVTDGNGVPGHSISIVVEGGDTNDIAKAIANSKAPGTGTYGSTSVVLCDPNGVPTTIDYFTLEEKDVYFQVTIQPLPGYISSTTAQIVNSIVRYFNDSNIGDRIYHNKVYSPANLQGAAAIAATGLLQIDLDKISDTFNVVEILLSLDNINFRADDLFLEFTQAAISSVNNGTIKVMAI
jgi:uncharacterized phage protein gp47/JayE